MTVVATLGSVGEEVNLLISQADDFGPHEVELVNEADGTRVNLTGATISGTLKKKVKDTAVAASFAINITDAVMGKFTFSLNRFTTQALTTGETANSVESLYFWDLKLLDSANRRQTIFYGEARVKPSIGQ